MTNIGTGVMREVQQTSEGVLELVLDVKGQRQRKRYSAADVAAFLQIMDVETANQLEGQACLVEWLDDSVSIIGRA